MTVKELIRKLQALPQDLPVAVYSEDDEGDNLARQVMIAHVDEEYQYQAQEYYCQGDSVPTLTGLKEWVVIL